MRLALIGAILCFAGAAQATTEGWPALYDVSGVAADDVLNVRASPSSSAEIIGTLEPDKTGVEVIAPNQDMTWGLVNNGDLTGWVSLAFLIRNPDQWAGNPPQNAMCFGTEPFWSLALAGDAVRLESPDALALDFDRTSALQSQNRIDRHTNVYENDLGGLVATLRNTSCSDGMSDRAYGWEVDLLLVVAGDGNAQMLSGCCSISP